jgi:collagen type VII alpha
VKKFRGLLLLAASAAVSAVCLAQSPTSRTIPESATTTLPANTTQTVTAQLWSSATGGNLVLSETEPSLSVDNSQRVAFLLGSQTVGGLSSSHFVSGNSLYLDILQGGVSVISGGRVPLYAAPFSLTTGPAGPTGPQGPMGLQGLKGATGPQGATGLTGATGAKGATGATGLEGPRGIQGVTGATGATGPQGPTGPKGSTGATGATGAAGPTGPRGLTGATGAQGIQGLTGAAGPVGSQGLQGLTGTTGPQGSMGSGFNFRNTFDPTATYAVNDVVTYSGSTFVANAANGPNPLTPDANPSAWVVMAAQGASGVAGAVGPQGPIGVSVVGPQGPAGADGTNGMNGAPGPQGPVGATGPQGTASMPSGTWNYIASMLDTVSSSHQGAASGVLNGQFLVANGANGSNDTESYNPITNQWTALAPSPAASVYAAGAVMNGQFYMVGGCSPVSDCRVSVSGVMEIYNPTSNTWSYGPPMPTARYDAASAVINGKLYVAGGDLGCPVCTNVSTLEIFDPVANAWTSGSPMPNVLMGARGAAVNGKLYVVGGGGGAWWPSQNYQFASHVSIYDPVGNTWTQSASSIPMPVFDPSVVTMNGLVYVISGLGASLLDVNAVQVYDPTADMWTSVTPLDIGRDQSVAGVISGVVYFAGGLDRLGSAYPTTAESFYQYPQGPAGPQGPIGPTGTQGPQGLQGPIGLTGAAGTPGAPGPQGTPGIDGAPGIQGIPGTNGTNGTNGASFNFRGAFDPNGSYAVNDVVTYGPPTGTNITYSVNLALNRFMDFGAPGDLGPTSGSIIGTITTDGTIGVLSASNIVNYSITLNDGVKTAVLTPSNATLTIGNSFSNGLSGTSTNLLLDLITSNGFLLTSSAGNLCLGQSCGFPTNPVYGIWSVGGDSWWTYSGVTGVQTIGTGGALSTGPTSTYIATGPIAAGTTTPGTLPWTMMAQAGAPGTPGAAGPAGPQGLQGLMGSPGPQGTPGINGLPGTNGNNGINGTNGLDGKSFNWRGAYDPNAGYVVNDVVLDGSSAYICLDPTPLAQGQTPSTQPQAWSLLVKGMGTAYIKSRLSYQGAIPDITQTSLYPPLDLLELPAGTFLISARVTVYSRSTDPMVVECRLQANPYNPQNPPNDWSYVTVGPGVPTGFGGYASTTYATLMTAQEVQIGPTESQLVCSAFDGASGGGGDVQVVSVVITAIPTGGFVVQ